MQNYFSGLDEIKSKKEILPEDIKISEIDSKIYGYEYLFEIDGEQQGCRSFKLC